MVTEVRERLTVNKQAAQNINVERLNVRNVREHEIRKEYRIKISNRTATLEKLKDCEDINRASENIKENTKTSAKTV